MRKEKSLTLRRGAGRLLRHREPHSADGRTRELSSLHLRDTESDDDDDALEYDRVYAVSWCHVCSSRLFIYLLVFFHEKISSGAYYFPYTPSVREKQQL